jgi:hypothetical protein
MRTVYAARSSKGTKHVNTVRAVAHPTFAVAEFFRNSDSDKMRARWLGLGLKDVTPLWSTERHVHTFSTDADVPKWPTFQEQLSDVEADWYYVSGHHGRQFMSDFNVVTDDPVVHGNTQAEVGFFNERYHQGRWKHNTHDNPGLPQPNEVFVSTSDKPASAPLGPVDNPLYLNGRPDCKGMILMGCNTLAYKTVRNALMNAFAKAVIIGFVGQTPLGDEAVEPIRTVLGRSFFIEPPTDTDKLKKLVLDLNTAYRRVLPGTMAVQQGSSLYKCNKQVTDVRVHPAGGDLTRDDYRHA